MTDTSLPDIPYSKPEQQRQAALTGMHIFLGTEIMLFGALFLIAAVIRFLYTDEVVAISKEMHSGIGAANTAILLTASLLAALAVGAAQNGRHRTVALLMAGAAILGIAFLGLKGYEYWSEFHEGTLPVAGSGQALDSPKQRLFMDLYLISTSLHAFHLTAGIVMFFGFAYASWSERLALPARSVRVENAALYWHLVDLIWVFLYPVLYLVR